MTPHATTITLFPIICFVVSFSIIGLFYRKKLARFANRLYRKWTRREGQDHGYDRVRGGRRASTLPVSAGDLSVEELDCEPCEKEGNDEEESQVELDQSGDTDSITSSMSEFEYTPQHTGSVYLHDGIVIPASPVIPAWERMLNRRIEEGSGVGAWVDWAVDRAVRWYQEMVIESEEEIGRVE